MEKYKNKKGLKLFYKIGLIVCATLLFASIILAVVFENQEQKESSTFVAHAESYEQIESKEKQYLLIPIGTTFVGDNHLYHNQYYSSTLYLAVGQDIIMFNFGVYDSWYLDTPNVLNSVDCTIGGNYITFVQDFYLPFFYDNSYLTSSICLLQLVDNAGNVYELSLNPVPVVFEIVTITFYNSTDLNNSYNNGFTAGKNSVDTDSYYNQGYQEGYQDGLDNNDAYDQGYDQGYENGYREGEGAGGSTALYGVFNEATVDLAFDFEDDSEYQDTTLTNVTPQYIQDGVYLENIYNEYKDTYFADDYLYRLTVTVNFANPFSYNELRPFSFKSNATSDVYDILLFDTNGNSYAGQFDHSEVSLAVFPPEEKLNLSAPITKLQIKFGRPADTFEKAQITQLGNNYYGGYSAGYNEGYQIGKVSGKNEGYSNGYQVGYDEGVAENVSSLTGFDVVKSLLSSAFSLFEIKIFGWFSLGDIVAVVLIIGVVFFLFKLVRG